MSLYWDFVPAAVVPGRASSAAPPAPAYRNLQNYMKNRPGDLFLIEFEKYKTMGAVVASDVSSKGRAVEWTEQSDSIGVLECGLPGYYGYTEIPRYQ